MRLETMTSCVSCLIKVRFATQEVAEEDGTVVLVAAAAAVEGTGITEAMTGSRT